MGLDAGDIQALEQPARFPWRELDSDTPIPFWPPESLFFKTSVKQPESIVVPVKNFDFVAYYYGEKEVPEMHVEQITKNASLFVKRKGFKYENFYHFLRNYNIKRYKAIWVADDDIMINTASINRMFKIFSEHGLWIAQPSFDLASFVSHDITRNIPNYKLHYTNFIENNVAIFSTKIIPILKKTFKVAQSTGKLPACSDIGQGSFSVQAATL